MDIVLRATVAYVFIVFMLRIIGRRELSSLEPFDLILLIVVGDAVQQGLNQDDYSLTGALLVVSTFAVLQVCISWISYRFPKVRPVLDGEPIIIVQDGKVIDKNMKRERLTVSELAEEARKQQIAAIADVQWAVLETSGVITFIKKR